MSCALECSASSSSSGSESEKPRKLTAEEREQAKKALDRKLAPLSFFFTRHAIHKVFRRFASSKKSGGRAATPQDCAQMVPNLAAYLEVPVRLFARLEVACKRYDFDGDGLLDQRQCTQMFRSVLRQKRKLLGERQMPMEVPETTLAMSGYSVVRELGRGGQGVMYLCTLEEVPYCLKFFSKSSGDEDSLQDLLTEYQLMKGFQHPNVAKTFEVFQDSEFFYLVNEPYFGGDLTKLGKLAHDQGLSMSEAWWRGIFDQCLQGLEYLHAQAVMHCDIKEENIMLADVDCEEPRIVLIDFGLAEGFASSSSGSSGTAGYIPPETWENEWWYPRGDVFSMGVVFFQLMVGQVPNGEVLGVLQTSGDHEEDKAVGLLAELPWPRFPERMLQLAALVASMTRRQMALRPSAARARRHEWFASESDEELPREVRAKLVGCGAAQVSREQIAMELAAGNNLQDLRLLVEELRRRPQEVERLLREHGVRAGVAREHQSCGAWMEAALHLRESYSQQFLQDLFQEEDFDEEGQLTRQQVERLLRSGAMQCDEEGVQELLAALDFDEDGYASVGTLRALMLKDGRVARRMAVYEPPLCDDCPRCSLM